MNLQLILLFLFWVSQVFAQATDSNILPLDAGTIQVNSSIDQYENLKAGKPIRGTIMVTHDNNQSITPDSFYLGDKHLKTEFLQTTPISAGNALVVSIYAFTLEGMEAGSHELPPIRVKVAGSNFQSPPLFIEISN